MTNISRRNVVAAVPAALIAGSMPTAAMSLSDFPIVGHSDAALLALRAPFDRTWQAYKAALDVHSVAEAAAWRRHREEPQGGRKQIEEEEGLTAADALVDETERANREVVVQMCEIPADTIEGLAFKAKVSLEHEDNRFEELVTSIMDDILAMAGGAHA